MTLTAPRMNLAPWKYAGCFAGDGGPIERIEESSFVLDGHPLAVANAWLTPECGRKNSALSLHASSDGTGVHESPMTARHIAISEALERWAYHQSKDRGDPELGFDIDPTSTGMAAYPGLFAGRAREHALREAVERYGIIAWWSDRIEAREVDSAHRGYRCYTVEQPFPDWEVVILRKDTKEGFTAFGYGAGRTRKDAQAGARLELERTRILLDRFFQNNPGFEAGDLSAIKDYLERRMVYFALPEGVAAFERRLENNGRNGATPLPPAKPELVCDRRVDGPWSRYTTVWRVLFEPPTLDHLDPGNPFFLW